jgi:hypothetical protein
MMQRLQKTCQILDLTQLGTFFLARMASLVQVQGHPSLLVVELDLADK